MRFLFQTLPNWLNGQTQGWNLSVNIEVFRWVVLKPWLTSIGGDHHTRRKPAMGNMVWIWPTIGQNLIVRGFKHVPTLGEENRFNRNWDKYITCIYIYITLMWILFKSIHGYNTVFDFISVCWIMIYTQLNKWHIVQLLGLVIWLQWFHVLLCFSQRLPHTSCL